MAAFEVEVVIDGPVIINAWNTIGVATRAWQPGSYQP